MRPRERFVRERERRPRRDGARDVRRALAQEGGDDQPAHAVAHQLGAKPGCSARTAASIASRSSRKSSKRRTCAAHALRAAVSLVIVGVHGAAARARTRRRSARSAPNARRSRGQQQHALGSLRQPGSAGTACDRAAVASCDSTRRIAAGSPCVRPAGAAGICRGAQDSACRSTASRAARTRARYATPRMSEPQK